MRDPLKNYIDEHRTELDNAVPSDKLWTNIETAMTVALPAAGIASTIPWLKYFAFGLSSVVGAGVVYTALSSSSPQVEAANTIPASPAAITMTVNEPEAKISVQAPTAAFVAPATPFVLANSIVALPAPDETPVAEFAIAPPAVDTVPQETVRFNAAVHATLVGDTMFTGIKRVEVIASSASVIVQGTTGSGLSVMRSHVQDTTVKFEYKRTDTLLQISVKVECKKTVGRSKKNCNIVNVTTEEPELTLNIPAGTSVVVQNTYGDTKVSGVTAPVCDVRSSSGDVQVASIIAATSVVTSYGDLDASDITGNFTARLSSGELIATRVNGNVDVVSTYGDLVLTDINGNLKANGSSGNISITKLRGELNANTTYGSIVVTDFKGSARLVSSSGSITGDAVELTANSTFFSL